MMASVIQDDAVAAANFDQKLEVKDVGLVPSIWSREFVELLVTQFVFGLGFSAFYLLPKYLRVELRATAAQIGFVTGIGLVAAVVATPFVAWWLSGGRRRSPAMLGLLLLSASAFAFTRVTKLDAFLLTLRIVQGVAFSLFISAIVARAAELVPKPRLAQAMGYVGLASLVTNALSPALAESIAVRHGWPTVFFIAGACGLLALSLASRLGDPVFCGQPRTLAAFAVFDRYLLTIFYATVICGVGFGVMFTYTQPLALERGAQRVGRLFTGFVIGAAVVRLLFSSVADRIGRGRISVAALVAYAAVMVLNLRLTPVWMLTVGLGLGVTHGILYPALNAMALERATTASRGMIATLFSGAFSLGHAASVLGLGVVADAFGYDTIFIGSAVLTLTGAWVLSRADGPSTQWIWPACVVSLARNAMRRLKPS